MSATDRSPSSLVALVSAASALIGAIVGAAITGAFNYASHKADIDAKMIELGVGILRSEPTSETTPLRD